jgi:hypothetical protein
LSLEMFNDIRSAEQTGEASRSQSRRFKTFSKVGHYTQSYYPLFAASKYHMEADIMCYLPGNTGHPSEGSRGRRLNNGRASLPSPRGLRRRTDRRRFVASCPDWRRYDFSQPLKPSFGGPSGYWHNRHDTIKSSQASNWQTTRNIKTTEAFKTFLK